ncbi:hypothetical protein H4R33_006273 [Dimargaris cristalligena]|nr:hypothetical protein H4R33_006273 [Dimargaris cristalligena]
MSRNCHFKQGVQETFDPWQELLYHQLAIGHWRYSSCLVKLVYSVENTDVEANLVPRVSPDPETYLKELLEVTRDGPVFQKDLFDILAAIIMVRLALTGKFDHVRTESDYRHKDERTLSNSYLADEMRKLDLVKKLDADTRSKLTDLGFWKHDDIWEYGQLFADRFPDVNLS